MSTGQLELALLAIPARATSRLRPSREGFAAAAPRRAALIKHRGGSLTERDLEDQTVLLLKDGHCLRDQALEAG